MSVSLSKNLPETIQVLKGQPLLLSVEVGEESVFTSTDLTFQWQKREAESITWINIPGASRRSFVIDSPVKEDEGFYRCVITDPVDITVSNVTELFVIESIISFTKSPVDQIVLRGDSVTFEAVAKSTGRTEIFYFWEVSEDGLSGWTKIPGALSTTITIDDIGEDNNNYYRCTAVDNISDNSPLTTSPVEIRFLPIELDVQTEGPINLSIVEGERLDFRVSATLTGPTNPSFAFEKEERLNGIRFWEPFITNNTGEISFNQVPLSFDGKYRCIVSDPLGYNNSVIVRPINITVNESFKINGVKSTPSLAKLNEELVISPIIIFRNTDINYAYFWQRRKKGSEEWKTIPGAIKKDLKITFTGADFEDEFRCGVTNSLGRLEFSSSFEISADIFADITKEPQEKIKFKAGDLDTNILSVEVASTDLSKLSYQWQVSYDGELSWSDIVNEINQTLELSPTKIVEINAGKIEDFYRVRLEITFSDTDPDTVFYSSSTLVNLLDRTNLFGEGGCVTQEQAEGLYEKFINIEPFGLKERCGNKNDTGFSLEELFDTYPIYDPQKGLYKTWGEIEFPWQLEEARDPSGTTCNLVSSETDDKWQISEYKALYSYFPKIVAGEQTGSAACLSEREADRVLRIEDDGFRICLYEAQALVGSLSGPFDESKWKRIGCATTSVPAGVPTQEEIKERFPEFVLDLFLENWEEYNVSWNEAFFQTSLDSCTASSSTIEEIEKCVNEKTGIHGTSDDKWGNARIRRDFFYREGDFAWFEGECEDTVCLYINIRDIEATEENKKIHANFPKIVNGVRFWEKVYCSSSGTNKCLSPKKSHDLDNYQLVELGSKNHIVEQPIPYFNLKGNKLCEEFETLNEFSQKAPPKVLTKEEIDALDQP